MKGPIPIAWVTRAARLPGKALAIGIALRYLDGMTNGKPISMARKLLGEFGVGRSAAYRGLKALERAHLVYVQRRAGCAPKVTILAVTEMEGAEIT